MHSNCNFTIVSSVRIFIFLRTQNKRIYNRYFISIKTPRSMSVFQLKTSVFWMIYIIKNVQKEGSILQFRAENCWPNILNEKFMISGLKFNIQNSPEWFIRKNLKIKKIWTGNSTNIQKKIESFWQRNLKTSSLKTMVLKKNQ